jgi:hypothetical protein
MTLVRPIMLVVAAIRATGQVRLLAVKDVQIVIIQVGYIMYKLAKSAAGAWVRDLTRTRRRHCLQLRFWLPSSAVPQDFPITG